MQRNDYATCLRYKKTLIPPGTNVFRVIDGAGEHMPGVFVDQLGERVLVATKNTQIPEHLHKELSVLGVPVFHKRLDQQNKIAPEQIYGPKWPLQFTVKEQGVQFKLDLSAGYSQGLFLDQRNHRQQVRQHCVPGMRVLNTFAYTGAFSVYAALAGAQTTTLDLSQTYLNWAKENFVLNNLDPAAQYFCKGDTLHWLERFAKQGRTFHGIILDPPTFSRDAKGKVFHVATHFGELVALAARCLSPGGWLFCSCNFYQWSQQDFYDTIARVMPGYRLSHDPMPPDFTGEHYLKSLWVEENDTL